MTLEPAIGAVLDSLRREPQTLLGRMSGSGSACFALCADVAAARRWRDAWPRRIPDWWGPRLPAGRRAIA